MAQSVTDLARLLQDRPFVALTGAGISTESGIPDYRGPGTRERARRPIQDRAFDESAEHRQRYWARSVVGWQRVSAARPNAGHRALARLEALGACRGVITQNVDGLHQAAGSERVIELHGRLRYVRCLRCGQLERRVALQHRLLALNPGWLRRDVEQAPDGDAELAGAEIARFRVAPCLDCQGPLKPDVVFFGGTVPRERVEQAMAQVEEADALLVLGSSLTVFSGYRFVIQAKKRGIPVAIVTLGPSRGDASARIRVDAPLGEVLPHLARELGATWV